MRAIHFSTECHQFHDIKLYFYISSQDDSLVFKYKQLIFNIFTVEICGKNILFKQKTIIIGVNFMLWEKLYFRFNQFDFFCNFPSNNFDGAGGDKKEPRLLTFFVKSS